jgi:hypothetical protein
MNLEQAFSYFAILLITFFFFKLGFSMFSDFKHWNKISYYRSILKKHGYTARLYSSSWGQTDEELCRTLEFFATDHLIFDRHGEIVGRVVPTMVAQKKPHLRLVVSNP